MKQLLFERKINGEVYKFYRDTLVSWVTREEVYYYTVETPENCFGYPDVVMFNQSAHKPYTLWRYLAPWKLKKIEYYLFKNGYNPYIEETAV